MGPSYEGLYLGAFGISGLHDVRIISDCSQHGFEGQGYRNVCLPDGKRELLEACPRLNGEKQLPL